MTHERLAATLEAIDVDDSGFVDIEELTAFGLRVGAAARSNGTAQLWV